jgi:Peroxidase, family 2
LSNHHVLPHDGKGLTKDFIVKALSSSINLDPKIASLFATYAITLNPEKGADFFDLDHVCQHGAIEHDVSLSRQDIDLGGDNTTFDADVFSETIAVYGDAKETTFETASKVRAERFMACKKAHAAAKGHLQFGIKECFFSYGETALLLGFLGDPKNGKVPIDWIKTVFGKFFSVLPHANNSRARENTIQRRVEAS